MSPTETRRSIRLRLTLATAALVVGSVALALLGLYAASLTWLTRDVDDELRGELAELSRYHETRGREGLADEIRRRDAADHDVVEYIFAESQLELIAGTLPAWPPGLETDAEGRTLEVVEPVEQMRVSRRLRMFSRVLRDGRRIAVGRDVTEHERFARALRFGLVTAAGAAVVLALGAGLAVSRGLLGRVEGMNRSILRILAGRREERVAVAAAGDEFDELAAHFNRLLDENDRLVARMREVTDDVAHDLRTPLSRMRTHVESALAAPEEAGRVGEALHALRGEIDRVIDTFNALLHIAQIESGAVREHLERVELDRVVGDAVELYQPLAEERGLSLETDLEPGLAIDAARHLLAQALTNLIDNALKYGSGEVRVTARRHGERALLCVADRGPGIPDAERERVLQRFVRLDTSRRLPGTGLGLSFVAAVAELHGASLELEDAGPGLRVCLSFPIGRG